MPAQEHQHVVSSVKETMAKLRVSRPTIYAMIARGDLVAVEYANKKWITNASIDELLEHGAPSARKKKKAS